MKQQAPKTLPQKAETIESTRKTADILIGAACQRSTVRNCGGLFSLSDCPGAKMRRLLLPNFVRAIEVFADLCYNASDNAPRCGARWRCGGWNGASTYEKFDEWATSHADQPPQRTDTYGPSNEVTEVAQGLMDETAASA